MNDFGDAESQPANTSVPTVGKLPPILVKNIPLNELMRKLKFHSVTAEYKLCRIGIKVMVKTKPDYDKVKDYLLGIKAEFFSHDLPGEKPFKVVLRGLPNIETSEIATELTDHYKLQPSAVFRMTRRDEKSKVYRDSLYLIHFKKRSVTLSSLQAIRSLFSVIVKWEPYRGGRSDVTQCQKCLNFGHGTRNCYILPHCSNCAGKHATSERRLAEAVEFKCANCGGAHQGSSRECPKREEYKHIRKEASKANQPGRRKQHVPLFNANDFPQLPSQTQSHFPPNNNQRQTGAHGNGRPQPANQPKSEQEPTNELFTATELMEIFVNMTDALRSCRSKSEQIQVLASFVINYGV